MGGQVSSGMIKAGHRHYSVTSRVSYVWIPATLCAGKCFGAVFTLMWSRSEREPPCRLWISLFERLGILHSAHRSMEGGWGKGENNEDLGMHCFCSVFINAQNVHSPYSSLLQVIAEVRARDEGDRKYTCTQLVCDRHTYREKGDEWKYLDVSQTSSCCWCW